jgi:hypothetical protein
MNTPAPIPLPSASAARSMSLHDKIYTAALAAVAFFSLIGIVSLWAITQMPAFSHESLWAIHMVILINACFFSFEVAILIVRIAFPKSRKWPTIALNIVLLLSFPLGTALSIYGFWKVDKQIPA